MKNIILLTILVLSASTFGATPVGYYNNGSLVDGECMPESGTGFEVLKLSIDVGHIFGTSEMIKMLKATAADMAEKYPGKDRLQIEDISSKDGGDIDPHGSHENGQDVDLQYFKADGKEFVQTDSNPYAPEMVEEDGKVSSNFDLERNWELMKSLHKNGSVQMIFMDQKLKSALVAYAQSKGDYKNNLKVINSFRHVENHQDHLHVRLNCPTYAKGCYSKTK